MSLSTFSKIKNIITRNDDPRPVMQEIARLNPSFYFVKGITDANKNTAEVDQAIAELARWKNTRQQINNALSLKELKEKRKALQEALSEFNTRYWAMILCTISNATGWGFLAYSVLKSNRTTWKKIRAIIASASLGAIIEGSIHLYRAKMFFVLKYGIAKVELGSVNAAIEHKTHPTNSR